MTLTENATLTENKESSLIAFEHGNLNIKEIRVFPERKPLIRSPNLMQFCGTIK